MRVELPADLHAPAVARHRLASELATLNPLGLAVSSEVVVLVVSELVTNSVRAGASTVCVETVITADCVELRVSDDASGWPVIRHPDQDEPKGRGLAIVDDLADEWHTIRLGTGKQVTVTWSNQAPRT